MAETSNQRGLKLPESSSIKDSSYQTRPSHHLNPLLSSFWGLGHDPVDDLEERKEEVSLWAKKNKKLNAVIEKNKKFQWLSKAMLW